AIERLMTLNARAKGLMVCVDHPDNADALANAAKALRANGFTERELDLLFKINPAKILGIAPPAGTQ
ncbi:MAG TPA: hypothetical protein VFS23_26400, partial [Vicinamibacterales bacterium]|nr:hypothetical protein [Vicinamibacterales bacterium]